MKYTFGELQRTRSALPPTPHWVSRCAGRQAGSPCLFALCFLLKKWCFPSCMVPWSSSSAQAKPRGLVQGELHTGRASCSSSWLPPATEGPEQYWNCHEKRKNSAPSPQNCLILSKMFQRFDISWQPNRYFGNQNLQLLCFPAQTQNSIAFLRYVSKGSFCFILRLSKFSSSTHYPCSSKTTGSPFWWASCQPSWPATSHQLWNSWHLKDPVATSITIYPCDARTVLIFHISKF